jgi:hypothetical protein
VIRRNYLKAFSLCVGTIIVAAIMLMHSISADATNLLAPTWRVIASPNPTGITNILNGLTVLGPNNAWAVGSALDKLHGNQTLTEHWDGTRWRVVSSPTPGVFIIHTGHFSSVAAAGTNDVWAVGEYISDLRGTTHTLIEHWNGKQWRVVASPNPGSFFNNISSITAINSNNVWATGSYSSTTNGSTRAMTLHWNGHSWNTITTPSPANFSSILNGITAVSATNIWAVGGTINKRNNSTQSQVLIEHWDGARWSSIAVPRLPGGASGAFLQGVSKIPGGHQVWAVGGYYLGGRVHTLTEVSSGRAWGIVASPNRNNIDNDLMSVTAIATNNVWAVGGSSKNGPGQSLIEHWNGARWSIINNPNPGPRNTIHFLTSIMYSPANRQIWCVGFYGDGSKAATLTEVYR